MCTRLDAWFLSQATMSTSYLGQLYIKKECFQTLRVAEKKTTTNQTTSKPTPTHAAQGIDKGSHNHHKKNLKWMELKMHFHHLSHHLVQQSDLTCWDGVCCFVFVCVSPHRKKAITPYTILLQSL